MFDKRYACWIRFHEDCFCGAMNEAPEDFKAIDEEEQEMYDNYYPKDVCVYTNNKDDNHV